MHNHGHTCENSLGTKMPHLAPRRTPPALCQDGTDTSFQEGFLQRMLLSTSNWRVSGTGATEAAGAVDSRHFSHRQLPAPLLPPTLTPAATSLGESSSLSPVHRHCPLPPGSHPWLFYRMSLLCAKTHIPPSPKISAV